MRFDSSVATQRAMKKTIGLDPRLLRHSVIKMGSTLQEIKDVGGKAEWNGESEGKEQIML